MVSEVPTIHPSMTSKTSHEIERFQPSIRKKNVCFMGCCAWSFPSPKSSIRYVVLIMKNGKLLSLPGYIKHPCLDHKLIFKRGTSPLPQFCWLDSYPIDFGPFSTILPHPVHLFMTSKPKAFLRCAWTMPKIGPSDRDSLSTCCTET